MPATGIWCGPVGPGGPNRLVRLPGPGNRTFTVVTQALNEMGAPTNSKAMPSIGVWDGFDAVSAAPVGAAPGLNGLAAGETWLRVATSEADIVRIGIADRRGDGRPDYAYNGWVLYADTVEPARAAASGGTITIYGMGFRPGDTVLVGGQLRWSSAFRPLRLPPSLHRPPRASPARWMWKWMTGRSFTRLPLSRAA